MDKVLFIPCYMTMVVKRLSCISIQQGTVDCKYTMIIRIPKDNIPENVLTSIKNTLQLRINEVPLNIGNGYQNRVVKETDTLYIMTIRDIVKIDFNVSLTQTPFDQFQIPLKIELTSQEQDGVLYRFNFHLNEVDPT
jgi:hypothetical protein